MELMVAQGEALKAERENRGGEGLPELQKRLDQMESRHEEKRLAQEVKAKRFEEEITKRFEDLERLNQLSLEDTEKAEEELKRTREKHETQITRIEKLNIVVTKLGEKMKQNKPKMLNVKTQCYFQDENKTAYLAQGSQIDDLRSQLEVATEITKDCKLMLKEKDHEIYRLKTKLLKGNSSQASDLASPMERSHKKKRHIRFENAY